jgi:hypothetical protein
MNTLIDVENTEPIDGGFRVPITTAIFYKGFALECEA